MAVFWNDQLNKQFKTMRLARVHVRDIAAHFGTTEAAIYAHGRVIKVFVMQRRPASKSEVAVLREMKIAGNSDRQIAATLNRTVGSIRWIVEQNGLIEGRQKHWGEEDYERLADHVRSEMTTAEIASAEGLSIDQVRLRLAKINLKARRPVRTPSAPRGARGGKTGRPGRGAVQPFSAEQILSIKAKLGKESLRKIAGALGVSARTLKERALAADLVIGVSMRRIGQDLTYEKLLDFINRGLTSTEAGKIVGRDRRTIAHAAALYGLVFPTRADKPKAVKAPRIVHPESAVAETRESMRETTPVKLVTAQPVRKVPGPAARKVVRPVRQVQKPARARLQVVAHQEPKVVHVQAAPATARVNLEAQGKRANRPSFGWTFSSNGKRREVLIQSEVDEAVARFIRERGVTRINPGDADVNEARRLGFQVLRAGAGYILDGRIKVAGPDELREFVEKRNHGGLQMTG